MKKYSLDYHYFFDLKKLEVLVNLFLGYVFFFSTFNLDSIKSSAFIVFFGISCSDAFSFGRKSLSSLLKFIFLSLPVGFISYSFLYSNYYDLSYYMSFLEPMLFLEFRLSLLWNLMSLKLEL